jgi:hypothetical protein
MKTLLCGAALLAAMGAAVPALAQETTIIAPPADKPSEPPSRFGVGVRARVHGLPSLALDLFYDQHPGLLDTAQESLGIELIRRKGSIDLRISFDYSNYSGSDGDGDVFLAKGDDIGQLEFVKSSLQLFSADLSAIGSAQITSWMHFTYGAGLGLGLIRGELVRTDTFAPDPNDPATRRRCNAVGDPDINCLEVDFVEDSVPPVFPVLNMLLGMRFDLSKNVALRAEGGLRGLSVFAGSGLDFIF